MNVEEKTLVEAIADLANTKGGKPFVMEAEDCRMLLRLYYAPPMYVTFGLTEKTSFMLHSYPKIKRNMTLNTLLWKRLRQVMLGGRPIRVTRRMALGLLSLFDQDIRKQAGDDTENEDLEQ